MESARGGRAGGGPAPGERQERWRRRWQHHHRATTTQDTQADEAGPRQGIEGWRQQHGKGHSLDDAGNLAEEVSSSQQWQQGSASIGAPTA